MTLHSLTPVLLQRERERERERGREREREKVCVCVVTSASPAPPRPPSLFFALCPSKTRHPKQSGLRPGDKGNTHWGTYISRKKYTFCTPGCVFHPAGSSPGVSCAARPHSCVQDEMNGFSSCESKGRRECGLDTLSKGRGGIRVDFEIGFPFFLFLGYPILNNVM